MSIVALVVFAVLVILCHAGGVALDAVMIGLGIGVFALALVALCIVRVWFRRQRLRLWREWHYGMEPRLVPIEPSADDPEFWITTEGRAVELRALGFEAAGQYQERDTAYPITLRTVLSRDGRIFAVIIPGAPRPLVTFLSVLDDRTQIRTSDADLRVFPIPDGFPERLHPEIGNRPIEELLQRHAAHLGDFGRFEQLRTLTPADFPRIWSDHHRSLVAHLVAIGWFAPAGDGSYRTTPEGVQEMDRGFRREWYGMKHRELV